MTSAGSSRADDLRQQYADAIKAAAVDCDGNCGRTEQECADHVELVWAGTARQDRPDEVTWVQGTTTALADVVRAVRDTELETARDQFARIRSQAMNRLDTIVYTQALVEEQRRRAEQAEAAIDRVRDLHRIHWCEVDGHKLDRTPNPCVNNGICRCGQRNPCPTLDALDSLEET